MSYPSWTNGSAIVAERSGSDLLDRAIRQNVNADTRIGGAIALPRGTLFLDRSPMIDRVDGLTIGGKNKMATILRYVGSPGPEAIVTVQNSRAVTLQDLTVETDVPVGNLVVFKAAVGSDPRVTTTGCSLRRVDLECKGMAQTGHAILSPNDQNNEHHVIEDVEVRRATLSAFLNDGTQAKKIEYLRCHAKYGRMVLFNKRGSFNWTNGTASSSLAPDFFVGTAYEGCTISGHDTEGGVGIFESAGPSGADWPLVIEDIRLNIDYAKLVASTWPFLFCHLQAGPVVFQRNVVALNGPIADKKALLLIHKAFSAASLRVQDNNFVWEDAAGVNLPEVRSNDDPAYTFALERSNNQFQNAAGALVHVPNW